jgi:hypothetical protein
MPQIQRLYYFTIRNDLILTLTANLIFFGALSVFLGQDLNWNLRNYHWQFKSEVHLYLKYVCRILQIGMR